MRRVDADLGDLERFYNIPTSPRRHARLSQFYSDELDALFGLNFDELNQEEKTDFLLLRNFLRRKARQLELEKDAEKKMAPLLPFAPLIVSLCEARQDVEPMDAEKIAASLTNIAQKVGDVQNEVEKGKIKTDKTTAYKAAQVASSLREHLEEFFHFYFSYDPSFDFWATRPWQEADAALKTYVSAVQTNLAGMRSDGDDDIIGEPIGEKGLINELEAEMIPYTPSELVKFAREHYKWCEAEMKKASHELGFGDDWKKALEYVKDQVVPPGQQRQLVMDLAREGASFVRKHDLVTVPSVVDETIRMFMMSASRQKESPFFLGGPSIIVSYPTAGMSHDLKRMVMRGNNRHFSRATAFHELVPGHRLQLHVAERRNSHRQILFETPFYIEGWAMYWELLFWRRGDFFVSPEDRVGTLFWRMHRCARIVFSLGFHLGEMTPQECIDLLVDWVGHERSNAEGEVRRSFKGEYDPLYQCGYLLGALQLWELRREVVDDKGVLGEKEFHDKVLEVGTMPIELMRALILGLDLTPEYKAKWRFY